MGAPAGGLRHWGPRGPDPAPLWPVACDPEFVSALRGARMASWRPPWARCPEIMPGRGRLGAPRRPFLRVIPNSCPRCASPTDAGGGAVHDDHGGEAQGQGGGGSARRVRHQHDAGRPGQAVPAQVGAGNDHKMLKQARMRTPGMDESAGICSASPVAHGARAMPRPGRRAVAASRWRCPGRSSCWRPASNSAPGRGRGRR